MEGLLEEDGTVDDPYEGAGAAWPGLGLGSGSGLGRGLGLGYWLEVINGPLPELSSSACILRSLALVRVRSRVRAGAKARVHLTLVVLRWSP